MKTLQIIQSAYRATLEEQDDTIIWITRVFQNADTQLDVLLRGNAVNYAVRGQSSAGLKIGGWQQRNPPRVSDDLAALASKGATVYAASDDLVRLGIEADDLLEDIRVIPGDHLAGLVGEYDRVWAW